MSFLDTFKNFSLSILDVGSELNQEAEDVNQPTVTNEFAFLALFSFVLLQLVADSKDMTIFGSNNIVLERQTFQTIPAVLYVP